LAVSTYLANHELKFKCGDYNEALKGIRKGAFVYFDPPYDPVSSSASFTGYTQGGFDADEQERLCEICKSLNRKGVKFMLSNSDTDRINSLYKEFNIDKVLARRNVNSDGSRRGEVFEVIVRNYE
jgi:DNA adenine methylase